jgi:hypothetical protein
MLPITHTHHEERACPVLTQVATMCIRKAQWKMIRLPPSDLARARSKKGGAYVTFFAPQGLNSKD